MGMVRWAVAGALCVTLGGCDKGPKVTLADDPVGKDVLGMGGSGEAGIEAPASERRPHWARGPDGRVRGKLVSTSFNRMVVVDSQGNRHSFSISPGTVIRQSEQPASALVLEPGSEVEARYLTWKGHEVVAEVHVLAPPPAGRSN